MTKERWGQSENMAQTSSTDLSVPALNIGAQMGAIGRVTHLRATKVVRISREV